MDAIDYLFSLEWLGVKFGLDTITALCTALGRPQHTFRTVLVAGTNGKGSVAVMIDTALRAAGHATARYTSPHLVRLEERFVIGGHPVATDELRRAADAVRTTAESLQAQSALPAPPTFFEATTAVAFELFRRAGVELAVLEVGLGGRLDATNVAAPMVSIITTVDLDHQRFLGSDLASIAREKAGVVRPGGVTVTGEQKPEALAVIEESCRARGAQLVRAWDRTRVASEWVEGRLRVELAGHRRYGPVTLGLRGRHQLGNALVAVAALEALDARGVSVPRHAVDTALADAAWPGRLELVTSGDRQVLLDAAHNPAGARALAAYLREQHPDGLPIVFGVMRDKDVEGMLHELGPCGSRFVFTQAHTRRALPAPELLTRASLAILDRPLEACANPDEALARAWRAAPTACVAGSIFLVGDLRAALAERGAIVVS